MEIISRPSLKLLCDGALKFFPVTQIKYSDNVSDVCIGDYTQLTCIGTDMGKFFYDMYKSVKINPDFKSNIVATVVGMDGTDPTFYDWEGGEIIYDIY